MTVHSIQVFLNPTMSRKTHALLALLVTPAFAGIEITPVAGNLRDPMEIAAAPDGDLYVVEREGRLLRVRPSTGGVFEIGALEVTALRGSDGGNLRGREDGLLGVALDPAFSTNHRIYLYYSHPVMELNRLSRFEIKEGKLDPASEKILLVVYTERQDRVCHMGGSLAFGPHGLLFLSTGDNTNPFESEGYAPLDERVGSEYKNSARSAGNTNDLRGKILRIRPTEDGYEIPDGNLFPAGTPGTRPEVFAMGCRNPFRLSVNPKTGTVYWGEVGPDAGNTGPKGPAGYDEINQAKTAGNYGWPFLIGDNKPYPVVDFASDRVGAMSDPAGPVNRGRLNTGLTQLPSARGAFIWYPYVDSPEFPVLGNGGRNAMAGPVYHFNPARKYNLLEKSDDATLLTYDWMRGKIWKVKLGGNEECGTIEPLVDSLMHPMDLEMGTDGSVWLLEYGTDWYFNRNGRIRLLRPATGNHPPVVAVASVGDTRTATVSDPDGDAISVEWWLTEGADERRIGSGLSVAHDGKGLELRAVATDSKGAVAVAGISLVPEVAIPPLQLEFTGAHESFGFGEAVKFVVKGDAAADRVNVRARYIPPTGHDAGSAQLPPEIEKLVVSKQCFACHQLESVTVGPPFVSVALKYRDDPNAVAHLTEKLRTGGGGVWGSVPMPPQVSLADSERDRIVRAILSLSEGIAEIRGSNEGSLVLPPRPEAAGPGGAWEFRAESPGFSPSVLRVSAK